VIATPGPPLLLPEKLAMAVWLRTLELQREMPLDLHLNYSRAGEAMDFVSDDVNNDNATRSSQYCD
jgi:hypothetical protein